MRWQAEGKDVQSRLSAILTILGHVPAASVSVDVSVACQFQDGASWSSAFKGPSGHYQALASAIGNMVREAQDAHATVGLTLEFPKGMPVAGDEYEDLRESLNVAELGRIHVVGRPFRGSAQ